MGWFKLQFLRANSGSRGPCDASKTERWPRKPLLMLALGILTSTPGLAAATDCPGTDVDEFVYLTNQEAIDTYQANYGPCDRIAGSMVIDYVPEPEKSPITDLGPMSWLVEIGQSLRITGGQFPSLAGLNNLQSVGEQLVIEGSSPITNLAGLDGLVSAGDLLLVGLPNLVSLSGMTSLTAVQSLRLTSVSGLTDLSGLPASLAVGILVIEDTPGLTSLDGISAISGLEYLALTGNLQLADVGGLADSTFASDPENGVPSVTIQNNLALTSLAGLPVGAQTGSLSIDSNPNLTSLNGLQNLVEVWGNLTIVDNPSLSDCQALATVLDAVDDGDPGPGTGIDVNDPPDTLGLDYISLDGNFAGCNSISEILASVQNQVILEDSFEGPIP